MTATPHVVIVGAGFAGMHAAQELRNAPVRVTVIDRTNHHLFQPLLYQVATASLSSADISAPIRGILGKQRNTEVMLAHVAVRPHLFPDRASQSFYRHVPMGTGLLFVQTYCPDHLTG